MSLPDLQEPLTLLEEKNVDAAIEVLEQKVSELPAHLMAHVILGRAYEAKEDWEQALQSWGNAHFLMPNSPVVQEGKQRVLRRMDGLEADPERPPTPAPSEFGSEPDVSAETPPSAPLQKEAAPKETAGEESDEVEEEPSSGSNFGLAELRRHAEREARQGGARSAPADEAPSPPPSPSDSSTPDSPPSDSPPSEPSPLPDEPPPTPEDQIEKFEEEESGEDLDRLIDELESAKIEPDPDAEGEAPPPDTDDEAEDVVSETLARIHENQNNYEEAARIYTTLASQEPDRADEFQQKAAEMREKAGLDDTD